MILIYMNSGEWGGVDVFAMRFAEHLRKAGRDFILIDKAGSRLRTDIPWATFMTPEEAKSSDLRVTHFFTPSVAKLTEDGIPWKISPDATVFAWIVQHHDVLYRFFPHIAQFVVRWGFGLAPRVLAMFRGHAARISNMLDLMVRNNALAAMDGSTIRSFRFFYPQAMPPSILIPLPVPLGPPHQHAAPSNVNLSVGYLGRMDYFKFSALAPFVADQLGPIARTQPVTLVAITVGSHVEQLTRLCAEHKVTLRRYDFMPNDQARATLARETHFVAAMGTAALDIAAVGHPCIYIDPAEKADSPPQTRFRFVHETCEYMVGEFRDFPIYVGGLRSLKKSVDMVMEDSSLGSRGRDYVREHHDPDTINAAMLRHIEASTLTMAELEPAVMAIRASNARDLAWSTRLRKLQRWFDPRKSSVRL
jgi:hypothetical protein